MLPPWFKRSPRKIAKWSTRTSWTTALWRDAHTKAPSLNISPEVQDALSTRRPVVALESTIYTHGLPYLENLHLAARLEDVVRDLGATPATVGVIRGNACVGLSGHALAELLEARGPRKISRRDLGFALGSVNKYVLPFSGSSR